MNERDSEMIAVLLQRHGYALAERESQADAVIVNTCSVRAKAEDKAIGKLRMLIAARQEHPDRIVGVVGCMVQRLKDDLFRQVPGLDFAVGTHVLARVPAILAAVLAQKFPPYADPPPAESDPGYAGGFAEASLREKKRGWTS